MPFATLRLGLGAGIVAFVASVTGEVYRDLGIVGQRTVGWVILLLAIVGVISIVAYTLELQDQIDRCERTLRRAGLDPD